MDMEYVPFLMITANVGSVFEDPSRLLPSWISEFLSKVSILKPKFIALHLQEVGGKTYEKSMEYVQEFIRLLCESSELEHFNRIRVYLDEDYTSAEHFTALGNLYFIEETVNLVKIWNFLTHEWEIVEGKSIHTGNIESVPTKEKAKFPQHFFPECKWSRKGFLRTRWDVNDTVFDTVNIHLFHDASNLAASEETPSVYCKSRRRALVHTLERFHKDNVNGLAPYFVFGDFNFRCDTEGVVKKLSEDLTIHRILNVKNDHYKVQYRDECGQNVLTIGKKEFHHAEHQSKFKESWLQQFDHELQPLKEVLVEYPITFPPSYPYEEEPSLPHDYMFTRCPAWCDRILMSPTAKNLIYDNNVSSSYYNIIGNNICMGDHKPVFLSINLKTFQGTIKCRCEHAKSNINYKSIQPPSALLQLAPQNAYVNYLDESLTPKPIPIANANANPIACNIDIHCPYASDEFCNVLFECVKLNSNLCRKDAVHMDSNIILSTSVATTVTTKTTTATSATIPILPQNQNLIDHNNEIAEHNGHKLIAPTVSINVIDSENLKLCMCSLYASCDNVLAEQENMIGTICPRCQNIIKQQPTEHRKTLISKRLQLSKDIIVNRVDTHFLSLKTAFDHSKRYEPYTPESVESHSPLPDPDLCEFEIEEQSNDSITPNLHTNNLISNNDDDIFNLNSKISSNLRSMSTHSSAVSPRQLKSRLEILRKTSTDASGMVINSHIAENRINDTKRDFCFSQCCVIL